MHPGQRPPGDPGSVIDGKYRVERTLGVGGMGRVVLAKHLAMDRHVAIKLVASDGDPELGERLFREARAASRLTGEHIARVHDVGQLASGAPFLVMEFLHGRDLAAVIAEGRVAPATAALYVRQACEGVAEAHAAGIVHRDLKPANLFLTQRADGSACVKVLDFGIARTLDVAHPKLTAEATIIGSPAYMAPEQLTGKPADARTDIWSLGVVLYELLTGVLPYPEPSVAEQYARIVAGPPTAPRAIDPAIPAALSEIALRCLARSPAERFASARELAAALEVFGDRPERFGFATEPITVPLPRHDPLRAPLLIGAAAGLVAVALVAIVGARALHAPPQAPTIAERSAAVDPAVTATATTAEPPLVVPAPSAAVAATPPATRTTTRPVVAPTRTTAKPSATASADPFAHRTF